MTAAPVQSAPLSPGFTRAGHDSAPEDAPLSPAEEAILEAIAQPGADSPHR